MRICNSIYYINWFAWQWGDPHLWVPCKQHHYAHYNFRLTSITWIPTYNASSWHNLMQPLVISSCQQFLKSEIHKFKFDNSLCIQTSFIAMRLFSWGLALSHGIFRPLSWYYSHFHTPSNLPKTWNSISQTLGKSWCI